MRRTNFAVLLVLLVLLPLGISAQKLDLVFEPNQTAWYSEETFMITCIALTDVSVDYNLILTHNSVPLKIPSHYVSTTWSTSKLLFNHSGLYECNSQAQPWIPPTSSYVEVIDTSLISAPAIQYAYIDVSTSLECTSDYEIDSVVWIDPNSTEHNGTIEHVTVENEGQHICRLEIMGVPKDWPVDVYVVAPPTIDEVPSHITAYTTTSHFLVNVSYSGHSPLGSNISLYQNNTLINTTSFLKGLGTGQITIDVYQKSDAGNYRVVVETNGIDGVKPPYDLMDEISFWIDVQIQPKVPLNITVSPNDVSCYISWQNPTQDINPEAIIDKVQLVLFNRDSQLKLDDVTLEGSEVSYTFTGLTPASNYTLNMIVKNDDGQDELDDPIPFTTEEAAPSISEFTVIRRTSSHFNATLTFDYLGADNAFVDRICYRPVNASVEPVCDITIQWQQDHLTWKAQFDLSNSDILSSKISFMVNITNTAMFSKSSDWVTETLVSLSQPSQARWFVNSTSFGLMIELPTNGTPPILCYEIILNSDTAPNVYLVVLEMGIFESGEKVAVVIGDNDDELVHSDTNYRVTSRAKNLAGWSPNSDEILITTWNHTSLPTPETVSDVETWVIILAVVIPGTTCLILIIASILFLCLQTCYRSQKNGYSITPAMAAAVKKFEHSSGEQRHARQYFSYDVPLTPRPPTAEPQFTNYPFAQIDMNDSDSEMTDTRTPCYKYVVSPTPEEVGVKGFLGSNPGSGTFVYV